MILMSALLVSLFVCRAITSSSIVTQSPLTLSTCRNVPGSPGYPTNEQWTAFNNTVSGQLVEVVPFVKFCNTQGGCTEEQSASSSFRAGVPGEMDGVRDPLSFGFWALSELIHGAAAQLGTSSTHSCSWIVFFFNLPFVRTSFWTHHLFVNRKVQPPVAKEMSHFLVSSLNQLATYR